MSGKPTGPRFDSSTGQPIPKFDPATGKQNWWDEEGEAPPHTYITHNTQRVINTVKPKLLSVF
jgi:hypothetical protein